MIDHSIKILDLVTYTFYPKIKTKHGLYQLSTYITALISNTVNVF